MSEQLEESDPKLPVLAVGDKVYWNDPDEGSSSGWYGIIRFPFQSSKNGCSES